MLRWKDKSGIVATIVAATSLIAATKSYATNDNLTWDNQTWVDSTGEARTGSGSTKRDNRGTKSGTSTPSFDINDVSVVDPNVRKIASDLAALMGDKQTITAKCSGGNGSFKAIKAPTVAIPTAGTTAADLSHVQLESNVDFDLVFDRKKGYAIYKNGEAVSPFLHEINNKSIVAEGIIQNFKQEKFLNKYTRYIGMPEYAMEYFDWDQMYLYDSFDAVPPGYSFNRHITIKPENSPLEKSLVSLFHSSPGEDSLISETVTRSGCKRYDLYRNPAYAGCMWPCFSEYRIRYTTAVNTSCPVPTGEIDINKASQKMGALMNETYSSTMEPNYYSRVSGKLYTWDMQPVNLEYSYESVITNVDKAGLVLTHEKDNNGAYKKTVKVKLTPLGQTQGGSLIPIHPIAHKVFYKKQGFFYKADGVIKTAAAKPSSSDYPVNTYPSDSTLTCTFE